MASNRNIFNVLSEDENIRNRELENGSDNGNGGSKDNGNGKDTNQNTRKRARANDTPEKGNGGRFVARVAKEMADAKEKIGNAVMGLKAGRVADLAAAVSGILSGTLVEILEANASLISDLASELSTMDYQVNELTNENEKLRDELAGVKAVREKMEVKAACKEAEGKLGHAAKQCKLLEVGVGSCITDRKQLHDAARKQIREQVRADLRAAYDAKVARAVVAVVAKAPLKRTISGKETWTVPVLFTSTDRDSKWELEEILRKSNMHPTYHWPKEFLDPVKELRQVVVDMGVDPGSNYIRIRPEDKDGTWKLRADVKP